MKTTELKSFGKPDEIREFPKGRLELVTIAGSTIGRGIFQPGWKWSTSVQPIAKTKSCEAPHFQYQVAGIMQVRMDDGTELTSDREMLFLCHRDMMPGLSVMKV